MTYITYEQKLSPAQIVYGDSHILILSEKEYEWLINWGAKFDCVLVIQ